MKTLLLILMIGLAGCVDHRNGQAVYGCLNKKHFACNHGGTADSSTKPWVYLK